MTLPSAEMTSEKKYPIRIVEDAIYRIEKEQNIKESISTVKSVLHGK